VIRSPSDELKTLLINGKHRLLLNSNTFLSVNELTERGQSGCLLSLNFGEIFVQVEHNDKAFVVETAHGRAMITGTTFDVKVTTDIASLVVTEGSIRFESSKGNVEVLAGQLSELAINSAPSQSVPCKIPELLAWTTGHEIKTELCKIQSDDDSYDLSELSVLSMSGPVDLETIDYKQWIEEKRD